MAIPRKTAANKTTAKKAVTSKAKAQKTSVAKKAVTKKAPAVKPAIKKGSRVACQVCGFAFTVDRISGSLEEADLICCETPMKLRRPAAKKK